MPKVERTHEFGHHEVVLESPNALEKAVACPPAVAICFEEFGGYDVTPVQYAALIAIRGRPGMDQRPLSSRAPGTVAGRRGQRSGHRTPMQRTIGASEHRRKCASRKQGGADEASPQGDPE